jgi:hypothetical protein
MQQTAQAVFSEVLSPPTCLFYYSFVACSHAHVVLQFESGGFLCPLDVDEYKALQASVGAPVVAVTQVPTQGALSASSASAAVPDEAVCSRCE